MTADTRLDADELLDEIDDTDEGRFCECNAIPDDDEIGGRCKCCGGLVMMSAFAKLWRAAVSTGAAIAVTSLVFGAIELTTRISRHYDAQARAEYQQQQMTSAARAMAREGR